MTETVHPTWAIAAVALFGRHTAPLFIRTFTSPREVLEHADAATCANLYVSEEDVVLLHVLLFSSLDRCDDVLDERRRQQEQKQQKTTSADAVRESLGSPGKTAGVSGVSSGADVRFLGRLLRSHKFTSYGFQSASGIRTILAIVGDVPLDAVLPLCRTTYEAASVALCNPFRTPRMHARLLRYLKKGSKAWESAVLPAEYVENLRAAPTPETVAEEPSLAHSNVFRQQMRTIIEPFTATARSSLV